MARTQAAKVSVTVLAFGLIPLALAEWTCRLLTELRVLKYHRAIQTVTRPGHDDWRLATITGDESSRARPDPVWRPVAASRSTHSDSRARWRRCPSRRTSCGDVLRRFPHRRTSQGGLAELAAPAARAAASRAGTTIRGLERGRRGLLVAPGRAALPPGGRPVRTRTCSWSRSGGMTRPRQSANRTNRTKFLLGRWLSASAPDSLSRLSCIDVLHAW